MWLSRAIYDPRRWRAEQIYFNTLRATFDDPLPIHDYAPYHPLMIHNHVAENRARQAAVLKAIANYQAEEAKRGEDMVHQFELANPPQPGQPGYRPPAPNLPGYNAPPGEAGYDPNLPYDQPTHRTVPEPQKFEE